MTSVAVLGLGRMGSAMAARLAEHHDVRTWTRSGGGSPADAVDGVEVVLLCLYDGQACREVLTACLPALSPGTTIVNTTTVGPDEAADLDAFIAPTGATYLHAPVMGSTPLAAATSTTSEVRSTLDTLLTGADLGADDDIVRVGVAAPDLSWLADARLDVSPEVVADPAVLRPLHAYALTHATGDPSYLDRAFLPTARVEGYRDGEFVSWDLDAFATRFSGEPAPDEAIRSRRIERLDVRGFVATATMTLRHGPDLFTDVFVLLRDPSSSEWRIASKAFEHQPR